ncbi:hypothetical protein MHA_1265 [Mannheimia haemolytica PHL213]|nr:hypothetical protein MHA_1265 [Mannheimia haemolytica PHL213]
MHREKEKNLVGKITASLAKTRVRRNFMGEAM